MRKAYFQVLGSNAVYLILLLFIVIHLSRQAACSPTQSQASYIGSPPVTAPDLPIANEPAPVGVTAQK